MLIILDVGVSQACDAGTGKVRYQGRLAGQGCGPLRFWGSLVTVHFPGHIKAKRS